MECAGLATPEYRRVAEDHIADCHISTVWLGIEHGRDRRGHPLIFETMVFDKKGKSIEMLRYATEQEALMGHAALCVEIKGKLQ